MIGSARRRGNLRASQRREALCLFTSLVNLRVLVGGPRASEDLRLPLTSLEHASCASPQHAPDVGSGWGHGQIPIACLHDLQDWEPLSEKSLAATSSGTTFACSWPQQYAILVRRAWMQTSRDKLPLIVTGIQVRDN